MKVELRMSYSLKAIRDLEEMEQIVASSNNLEWDGWDVIHYSKARSSFFKPGAVFHDGEWHTARRYVPGRNGWEVPRSLVQKRGAVNVDK